MKIIEVIIGIVDFLHILWIKFLEFVRHSCEKFAFRFLKVSYIIYGNNKTETKIYRDDCNIIHTIESCGTNITSGDSSINT